MRSAAYYDCKNPVLLDIIIDNPHWEGFTSMTRPANMSTDHWVIYARQQSHIIKYCTTKNLALLKNKQIFLTDQVVLLQLIFKICCWIKTFNYISKMFRNFQYNIISVSQMWKWMLISSSVFQKISNANIQLNYIVKK